MKLVSVAGIGSLFGRCIAGVRASRQGRITGIVRDSSDAFAAGVTAKVKNERTGEERAATTNEQGYFLVAPLKPSTYTIARRTDGFAPIEYTGDAARRRPGADARLRVQAGRRAGGRHGRRRLRRSST